MDSSSIKIGFIGVGRMGEALLKGFLGQGVSTEQLCFTEHSEERATLIASTYGISSLSMSDLVSSVDLLWVCVKPQQVPSLLETIKDDLRKGTCIVSISAGVRISTFLKYLGTDQAIIRVMPNTPVLVGEGMSAFSKNDTVSLQQSNLIQGLLESVGRVTCVEEDRLDAVTGLSGSGPAYCYRLADVMARSVLEEGLDPKIAIEMAAQTMIGAGKMLLETGASPDELVQNVTSPNGTTAAGLAVFDQSSIETDLSAVIQRAVARSKELSED